MINLNPFRKSIFLSAIVAIAATMFSCEEDPVTADCEEVEFTFSKDEASNTYTFEVTESDILSDIVWVINGDTAQIEATETGESLTIQLQPGSNEVCFSGLSNACLDILGFCATVEVEDTGNAEGCPTVDFGVSDLGNNRYQFELENTDATSVYWKINGEVVNQGHEAIEETLEAGENEICVVASFDGCEEEIKVCKTVTVEGDKETCPSIDLSKTFDESTDAYTFTLTSSSDEEPSSIKWLINDEEVNADKELSRVFEVGSYDVCVEVAYGECVEEKCVSFSVSDCPDMAFTYQATGNEREYHFAADFEGIDNLEWYGWFIDGEEVEAEGTMNSGDNSLIYTFSEAGTYSVCIMTETPDCPQGTEFCKEIVVE